MGKYSLIILVIMVMGMIFGAFGGLQTTVSLAMFYGHLAGAIIVIFYYTYKGRKKRLGEKKRK